MPETSDRFNPRPGEPYGRCLQCDGLTFNTPEEASVHLRETFMARREGNKGHSVRVMNMTRPQRVDNEIRQLIDEAINGLLEEIDSLTQPGRSGGVPDVTEEEVAEALRFASIDLGSNWQDWLQENGEDTDDE